MGRGLKRHRLSPQQVDDVIALRKQIADLREAAIVRKRVEDALRRSEAWHRGILERCPAALGEIDTNGYLTFANDAFARMLGYVGKAELLALGTGIMVFSGPEERERVLRVLGQAPETHRFDAALRPRNGGSHVFVITSRTAGSGEGVPGFILVLGETVDLTHGPCP